MMAVEEEPIYKTHYVLDAPKGATVNEFFGLLEAHKALKDMHTLSGITFLLDRAE